MFGHQDDPQYQQHDDNAHLPDDVVHDTSLEDTRPEPSAPISSPAPTTVLPQPADDHADTPEPAAHTDELLDIKQQALTQLSPLIGHLDQTPEEKFRTTMMMIQASDNQALIKDAFAAAQAIGDEKARAQALLDVINEINYFTHNGGQQ